MAPTPGGDHFEKYSHSLRFKNSNVPKIGPSSVDVKYPNTNNTMASPKCLRYFLRRVWIRRALP